MAPLVAYMPQYQEEFLSSAIAVVWFAGGLALLVTGRLPEREGWEPRRVRALGVALLLLSVGLGASGFLVNAEPPGGVWGGHWGLTSTFDKAMFAVWVVFVVALGGYCLRDAMRALKNQKRSGPRETRTG
jgi:hypothetical protein